MTYVAPDDDIMFRELHCCRLTPAKCRDRQFADRSPENDPGSLILVRLYSKIAKEEGNPMKQTIYEMGLDQTPANFVALTPVTFMARTAQIYPGRAATVYNDLRRSWAETYERCRRFACALVQRGVGQGDTVSIMATNIPEMFEAHFAVPMSGAVLNAINTRLDAGSVAFILNHAETKVFIVDLCDVSANGTV